MSSFCFIAPLLDAWLAAPEHPDLPEGAGDVIQVSLDEEIHAPELEPSALAALFKAATRTSGQIPTTALTKTATYIAYHSATCVTPLLDGLVLHRIKGPATGDYVVDVDGKVPALGGGTESKARGISFFLLESAAAFQYAHQKMFARSGGSLCFTCTHVAEQDVIIRVDGAVLHSREVFGLHATATPSAPVDVGVMERLANCQPPTQWTPCARAEAGPIKLPDVSFDRLLSAAMHLLHALEDHGTIEECFEAAFMSWCLAEQRTNLHDVLIRTSDPAHLVLFGGHFQFARMLVRGGELLKAAGTKAWVHWDDMELVLMAAHEELCNRTAMCVAVEEDVGSSAAGEGSPDEEDAPRKEYQEVKRSCGFDVLCPILDLARLEVRQSSLVIRATHIRVENDEIVWRLLRDPAVLRACGKIAYGSQEEKAWVPVALLSSSHDHPSLRRPPIRTSPTRVSVACFQYPDPERVHQHVHAIQAAIEVFRSEFGLPCRFWSFHQGSKGLGLHRAVMDSSIGEYYCQILAEALNANVPNHEFDVIPPDRLSLVSGGYVFLFLTWDAKTEQMMNQIMKQVIRALGSRFKISSQHEFQVPPLGK